MRKLLENSNSTLDHLGGIVLCRKYCQHQSQTYRAYQNRFTKIEKATLFIADFLNMLYMFKSNSNKISKSLKVSWL